MGPRLNVVTLGVADLPKSRQFYQEAFGWKPVQGSSDQIVFFSHGGIIFSLYPMDLLAEDAGLPAERSGFSGISLGITLNSVDEVNETFRKAIGCGAQSLVEPRETFWGGYDCYFADPDGHHWEIAWAPFWQYDEKGSLIMNDEKELNG
ncbi:MAG TPA: VOC family protein [Prolixibacteraceae bacterium]|nr:VOC family protein [Prolixibacteraceae bacterium]